MTMPRVVLQEHRKAEHDVFCFKIILELLATFGR